MKNCNIYGIGNALVDFEILVTDEELEKTGFKKGTMSLIEEETFNQLIDQFKGKIKKKACGGSAANTMIGAQQLGSDCYYACKVANDDNGQFYREDLIQNDVQTNLSTITLPKGTTGGCLVLVTPDAERTMCTFLGITANFEKSNIDNNVLQTADYLYIEGYLASSPSGTEAAIAARETAEKNNIKTALTFSDPNMISFCKDAMVAILGEKVDLIFCNEAEACQFTEKDSVGEAMEFLKPLGHQIAITLGKKGALIFDGQTQHHIEGFPATAIDTTGAGDLFAGAFLAALSQGKPTTEAARLANFSASRVVTTHGPRLTEETLKEVQDFYSTVTV